MKNKILVSLLLSMILLSSVSSLDPITKKLLKKKWLLKQAIFQPVGWTIKVISKITKPIGGKILKPVGKFFNLIGKRSADDLRPEVF